MISMCGDLIRREWHTDGTRALAGIRARASSHATVFIFIFVSVFIFIFIFTFL